MAIRTRPRDGGAELRADLAERWRETSRDWARRLGSIAADASDAEADAEARRIGCYHHRADAIERGEPVLLANWEIPRGGPRDLTQSPYWWIVEPDGRVRPAEPSELPKKTKPSMEGVDAGGR